MPHYYCPCGSVLVGGSFTRSLKSPCLRLFISIRTTKYISPEEKVCDSCRGAYYSWKKMNSEFGNIFSRIEQEILDAEEMTDTNSVDRKNIFTQKFMHHLFFI
jgi:hypothetical protein